MTTGNTEGTAREPLLTSEEVAAWLRVSEATLCRWRKIGHGPAALWLSDTCPRYERADVQAWLKRTKGVAA